jgi:ABC-2 type transport system permease protein
MVEPKSGKVRSRTQSVRKNDILFLAGTIAILLLVNIISQRLFYRLDLTSEKRFTLSDDTKAILRSLDGMVYIRIYLEGDLNIPFKKFQDNIRDILDEFRIYGKSKIQYEFVNPFENTSQDMQNQIISELYEKGLKPSNIQQRDKEGGLSEKIVFPGALVIHNEIEIPLNFLLNNPGLDAEENLNNSIEALEYAFISTIKNITNPSTEKIAFLEGHGELNEFEVNDFSTELSKSYQVDRGRINGMPGILDEYQAVIVAKPTMPFGEADKFVIDQYIMNGGKVLWLIDAVQVSLDSLINGETMAYIGNLNLDDLFFRYGIRINPELLQDIQCNVIPVNMALEGNPPNFQPVPWLYYPLIQPNPGTPITQNLNLVLCRFANSIDTIEARKSVHKKALLSSSQLSRTKKVPSIVSLQEIKESPKKEDFTQSNILTGILLEGVFESAFTNRAIDAYFDKLPAVKKTSINTRMAIIADGDMIRNDVRYSTRVPVISPLGYDRFTRQTFGNKEFLINLVQYLADDDNLLELRGREFKIRLLDKEKIISERKKWTLLNMIIPSLLILILGGLYIFSRTRKFSQRNIS